eukprot:GFYU01039738.1.p2 GENE.GFYU01039738.1~~GFYU01039738.1.p2  ORF type:complete len:324 (-),score=68.20 GFYU01039738.1:255-1109(-)
MDLILDVADHYVLNDMYSPDWARDDVYRQALSIFIIVNIGGYALYFILSTLNYLFLFDHGLMKHPKFLENQIAKEIQVSCISVPVITILTLPIFLAEVRGYSKLYGSGEHPEGWTWWGYGLVSLIGFLSFNDMGIYWIHRWLHHPLLYKPIHKLHHKWLVPTPYAAIAFHPVDGWAQSLPYHIFIFLIPLHKVMYLTLFVMVQIWTISIHDGYYILPFNSIAGKVINGAAHHTDHHLYFYFNYGQYTTLWDRIGGSYRNPTPWEGRGPHDDIAKMEKKKLAKAS